MEKKSQLAGLMERLGYEYTVLEQGTESGDMVALFEAEAAKGRAAGYTPVLIPFEPEGERDLLVESVESNLEAGFNIAESLKKSLPTGAEALESIDSAYKEMMGFDADAFAAQFGEDDPIDPGFDDGMQMPDCFGGIAKNAMFGETHIMLVKLPTVNPWEAALMIPFGGMNFMPDPESMAAVLKDWYEKYGAAAAVITFDTLDLLLPAPIAPEAVAEAARQQLIFDFDIYQTGGPALLEKVLSGSRVWSFWWD